MYYRTTPSPVLTFGGPSGPTVGPEGGRVTVQFAPSPFTFEGSTNYQFHLDPPDSLPPGRNGCWSGVTGTWNPAAPNDIHPAGGAQVRIKHGASAVEETAISTPSQMRYSV